MYMEPEATEFLKKVSYSIGVVFVWLAILCIAAIKGDNAFIGEHVSTANVIFYVWAVGSSIGMVIVLRRLWRSKEHE